MTFEENLDKIDSGMRTMLVEIDQLRAESSELRKALTDLGNKFIRLSSSNAELLAAAKGAYQSPDVALAFLRLRGAIAKAEEREP